MKRNLCLVFVVILLMSISSCGNRHDKNLPILTTRNTSKETVLPKVTKPIQPVSSTSFGAVDDNIDVDLTALSGTMLFAEVFNILYVETQEYLGKTIKMTGRFNAFHWNTGKFERSDASKLAFACIITDATACCAEGIEFVLEGNHVYPDDYPEIGAEITVVGQFVSYQSKGYTRYRLIDARFIPLR